MDEEHRDDDRVAETPSDLFSSQWRCCICQEQSCETGNSAEPLFETPERCCLSCNHSAVIPARVMMLMLPSSLHSLSQSSIVDVLRRQFVSPIRRERLAHLVRAEERQLVCDVVIALMMRQRSRPILDLLQSVRISRPRLRLLTLNTLMEVLTTMIHLKPHLFKIRTVGRDEALVKYLVYCGTIGNLLEVSSFKL